MENGRRLWAGCKLRIDRCCDLAGSDTIVFSCLYLLIYRFTGTCFIRTQDSSARSGEHLYRNSQRGLWHGMTATFRQAATWFYKRVSSAGADKSVVTRQDGHRLYLMKMSPKSVPLMMNFPYQTQICCLDEHINMAAIKQTDANPYRSSPPWNAPDTEHKLPLLSSRHGHRVYKVTCAVQTSVGSSWNGAKTTWSTTEPKPSLTNITRFSMPLCLF
jgi:hypothetical protein